MNAIVAEMHKQSKKSVCCVQEQGLRNCRLKRVMTEQRNTGNGFKPGPEDILP